jgi:bacteriorhodopsin
MTEISPMGDITLVLLLVAIGIFGSLAVQSKNVKIFQFQISIILIIWIAGEIVDILGEMGLLQLGNFEELPSVIHMIAMIMISVTFWLRFYYAKRSGKRLADDLYE